MSRVALLLLVCLACTPKDAPSDPPVEPAQATAPEQAPDPSETLTEPAAPTSQVEEPPLEIDPESQVPAAGKPVAFKPKATPFGGKVWGFPQASSANGRIVLIRQFGPDEPRGFGHHGPGPGSASLVAHDLVSKDSKPVEFVDMDSSRRWLLLIHAGGLWLVDSGTGSWEQLARADMQDDGNPCLTPRHGKFSASGGRVGWILDGARQLRVRELAGGREWSVPSRGRIWVGWPNDADDGAILLELAHDSTDWPEQRTSCNCWWCNRFALSYSYGGWSGPSFAIHEVTPDGQRSDGTVPEIDFAIHGETSGGCKLVASGTSSTHGELLELGPWHWGC